jgi:formylmethanofuran dehydrogenase subunit E-like metal-binding protein
MSITEQAITEYRNTEQADAEKQQAVKQLNDFVSDELKKKGIVNSEFAITAETNIEDLVARGILKKSEDIEYVRKRIQTLRRVSQ